MLYKTPQLDERELAVLEEIGRLRSNLRGQIAVPRRWTGSLRRLSFARAVQASNTIEGYNASLDDVDAVLAGEEPLDASEETRKAVAGYRDAMTYVLQIAADPHFHFDESLVRSLHFMMVGYALTKNPGRWRPGAVWVRNEASGEIVYEGPDALLVPELMSEFVDCVNEPEGSAPVVRAAMAHLNLVLIHPFSDGNGRMARCAQTLVLAREQVLEPPFASIEEYLGRNTPAYYAVLADVAQGHWSPERDARPWLRFCLTAHLRQARTLIWRVELSELLWEACSREAEQAHLPERAITLLFNTAIGLRARNSTYRDWVGEEITNNTASRDLQAVAEAGLVVAHGERRGRFYTASDRLQQILKEIRTRKPAPEADPFE
jgi:Fic family protein